MKKRRDYISDIYYTMNITKKTFNKHVKNILTEKQYNIFKMRFDNDGNIKMTAEEIANQLGITRQAIDLILNKIYAKIIILCKRLNIDVDINKRVEKPVEVSEPTVSEHASELISSIKELKRLPGEKRLNNKKASVTAIIVTTKEGKVKLTITSSKNLINLITTSEKYERNENVVTTNDSDIID